MRSLVEALEGVLAVEAAGEFPEELVTYQMVDRIGPRW